MAFVVITVPAATVGSDLSNFPLMVRLSDMPSEFWAAVKSDGGDIRVKTPEGVSVAFDLSRFDYSDQDGVLFIRAGTISAAADSVWHIHFGDTELELLPVTDTYGRNAVWADYESVLLFGDSPYDRTGKGTDFLSAADPEFFEKQSTSPDIDCHQGLCFDGTHFIAVDTNAIYRFDTSWNLVTTNSDPLGDTGLSDVDHCGDPEYLDGKIYVPVETYPNSPYDNQHIAVFNSTTLAFIESFDISAQGHEISGICYNPEDGYFYCTSFVDSSVLYKYDPTDGSYIGTLSLTWASGSSTTRLLQGIVYWRGAFWINSSDSAYETYRVSLTGIVNINGFINATTTPNAYEGITKYNDSLVVLEDLGAVEQAVIWKPLDYPLSAGGGFSGRAAGAQVRGYTGSHASSRTFTMAASFADTNPAGSHKAIASYCQAGVPSSNVRVSMVLRNGTSLGVWESVNSWMECSPTVDPTTDQFYRCHVVYQDSPRLRYLYLDGTLRNSQTVGMSQISGSLNTLYVMQADEDVSENLDGQVGFVYLRLGVLSADWIAAEYAMLNSPATFYSADLGIEPGGSNSLMLLGVG